MTMPVYIKGMTISDDGELVIYAAESATEGGTGVGSVEILEAQLAEARELITEHDGIECTKHDALIRAAVEGRKKAEAQLAEAKDLAEKFILLVDKCDLHGPAIQCREASNKLARAIGFILKERVARQALATPESTAPAEGGKE